MARIRFEISMGVLLANLVSQNIQEHRSELLVSQTQPTPSFSIYCTSNLDTTGACNRLDNNQPIACEMVPGGVINCKQPGESAIQCVIYTGVIGSQAYFYCTRRTDPGIRSDRINGQRFSPTPTNAIPNPSPNKVSSPLPDALQPTDGAASTFTDPIKDVLN